MNLRKPIIYSVMVAFLLSGVALMATTTKPQPRKPIATPQPVEITAENTGSETVTESDLPAVAPQTTPEPTRRPVARPVTQGVSMTGRVAQTSQNGPEVSQAGVVEVVSTPEPTPKPNNVTMEVHSCVGTSGKSIPCSF